MNPDRSRSARRFTSIEAARGAGILLACLVVSARCLAQAPPVRSPFDKDDAEIQTILRLNWKAIDFDRLDARTRCYSFLALSKGLATIGAKADARLDLLMDYIDEKSLGETLAAVKQAIPDPPAVTFDDMKKVGAAWVQSPEGKQKLMGELTSISDDGLEPYLKLHERTARRSFEEALESRHHVRVMAIFLEKQGKLEDFKKWSAEEKKRRLAERQAEAAGRRADAAEAERERREAALAVAEQKRLDEAASAALRMEMAAQAAQDSGQVVAPPYEDPQLWGDDNDYWSYPYYYTNAYRGEVRDRLDDAWGRWQNKPRPTPRSGGRVGGRR